MKPSAAQFEVVVSGAVASIRLSPKAKLAYDDLQAGRDEKSIKTRRQLARYLEEFCENEPPRLADTHYKKEGSYFNGLPGGGRVAIWTFKPWQWRLYGAVLIVEGRKCFVGMEVDPDKKQDKADKDTLVAAALAIGKLEEYRSMRRRGR